MADEIELDEEQEQAIERAWEKLDKEKKDKPKEETKSIKIPPSPFRKHQG